MRGTLFFLGGLVGEITVKEIGRSKLLDVTVHRAENGGISGHYCLVEAKIRWLKKC